MRSMGARGIVALAAGSAEELRAQLATLRGRLDGAPTAPDERAPVRAALVATRPRDAERALATLDRWLAAAPASGRLHVGRGAALKLGGDVPRVGLLLPGQGVGVRPHAGALADAFPEAAAAHARAELRCAGGTIPASEVQLAVVAASLAALAALRRLGVRPAFALGHSLGELTALHWAGAYDAAALLRLARARGEAMVGRARERGGMAAVVAEPALLAELLEGSGLTVACFNAPRRHVVSGGTVALGRFLARARAHEMEAVELEVTGAFHSSLMADAAAAFARTLDDVDLAPPRGCVISTVTGSWLPADADLRAHLRTQMLEPVRFLEAARLAARHADLLIEAGPGAALAHLMSEIDDTPVVSLRVGERSPARLLDVVAATWVCGLTPASELWACAQRCLRDQPSPPRSRSSIRARTSL